VNDSGTTAGDGMSNAARWAGASAGFGAAGGGVGSSVVTSTDSAAASASSSRGAARRHRRQIGRRIEHPRFGDERGRLRTLGRHPFGLRAFQPFRPLGVIVTDFGRRARPGRRLQESELGQPARELVDALDGQIDAVGLGRPGRDLTQRLTGELQRELVLEIVETEIRPRLRIAHVDARDAVCFRGRCFQILPESGAGVVHPEASLQVQIVFEQHIVAQADGWAEDTHARLHSPRRRRAHCRHRDRV
jgi:hypothetical protein